MLDAVPENVEGFPISPAETVQAAAGAWRGDVDGSLLTLEFVGSATQERWTCADRMDIPQPPGSGVELLLDAKASLRTVDGQWNETVDVRLRFSEDDFDDGTTHVSIRGVAAIPLDQLRGTFILPEDLEYEASDRVDLIFEYDGTRWQVERLVNQAARGGDREPAWTGEPMTFEARE